jgi:hypothetical protein
MRLLRIEGEDRFSLVEFTGEDVPPYAILSHTWGPDHEEVTYQDMIHNTGIDKAGYEKIRFCGQHALKDGLRHFWVDTCCIDKSSSAELTESINSMFRWYQTAVVCYVTLQDLRPGCVLSIALPHCRWFKRGWTLQELLAPNKVHFFDQAWVYIGGKTTLSRTLASITGIPERYLVSGDIDEASVAIKMSWAAKRETKRTEDWAYCLLGIFGVNMPLIYGEGLKAFRRLQEEIIRTCNDLTIFAWETPQALRTPLMSPLAISPARFGGSHHIRKYMNNFPEFSITNKGLLLSADVPLTTGQPTHSYHRHSDVYIIYLGMGGETQGLGGGIYLRKIGPDLFCRAGDLALAGFGNNTPLLLRTCGSRETSILLDTSQAQHAAAINREYGLHVPRDNKFELILAYPEMLWDYSDRMFLRPKCYNWTHYPMVLVMRFQVVLNQQLKSLAVLCHHSQGPVLKIFTQDRHPEEYEVICQARYYQEGLHVQELDLQARSIRAMTNTTTIEAGNQHYQISVTLLPETLTTFFRDVYVNALCFSIDGAPTERLPRPS